MNAPEVSTTPTPAEIAQAQAILAQVVASQSTLFSAESTTVHVVSDQTDQTETHHAEESAANASGSNQEDVVGMIVVDALRKQKIEIQFAASINDPRFWSNLKRLDRLEEALKVPLFDSRSLQQFAVSAEDELIKTAMELACKTMTVPVMPTKAEITTLAESKYKAKQVKDAAKAAKASKAKAA